MQYEFLRAQVQHVVDLLVSKRYDELVKITKGKRLSRKMIQRAIEEYGRELIRPPSTAYDTLDTVEVTDAQPQRWSIRCDLWTREEGRSDLSLELTVVREGDGFEI